MKNIRILYILLTAFALLLSSCDLISPASTPTPIPLPPAQHVESALQWLETHALLKDSVDWATLRQESASVIANAKTASDTIPVICTALRALNDANAWMLVPGLEIPNFDTGYLTLYPENKVIVQVNPASPAEKAGLRVGDVIETAMDNRHFPSPRRMPSRLVTSNRSTPAPRKL
jgi:hypothetical protein